MKGVLIGTDYLEQGDDVKILEINTNSQMFNYGIELLDFNPLFSVLLENNITEFHYIYTQGVSVTPVGEGENQFIKKVETFCNENSITFFEYQVQRNSVTVPYIEDDVNKFILRQAYDTYAILDSTYTSDKFEFFNLMSGSSYVPNTYFSSSEDSIFLDSLNDADYSITNHPNLVQKDRYPSYDISQYPKLSIVPNSDELLTKKENLVNTPNHLLQEFVYDDKNVIDGYYSVIRSFDIIYGSDLDIINMGGYKHSALVPLSFCDNEFESGSIDLNGKTRTKYINKRLDLSPPIYHTDLESVILMSDDTLRRVDEINEGDNIKTINFRNYDTASIFPWEQISSTELIGQSMEYVTSSLISINGQEVSTLMIEATFEDGTKSVDSYTGAYYVELSGSNDTRFLPINRTIVGDKMVVLNKDTNELSTKEIVNLDIVYKTGLEIFNLDFEPQDFFLVDVGDNNFFIYHNECRGCSWSGNLAVCGNNWCDSTCIPCQGTMGGNQK